MRRGQANGREVFKEITEERSKELEAAVSRRRVELDNEWDCVEEGWTELEERMAKVGVRPADAKDSMVRLNVGGWTVVVSRSTLTVAPKSQTRTVLAALFEGEWDKRVPRDAKGRLVLDESPKCFKHVLYTLLGRTHQTAGSGHTSLVPLASAETLEEEDKPYVSHAEIWFGLKAVQHHAGVNGGSEILNCREIRNFLAKLQTWCPHEPRGLKLLYRASRDGFSASSFHVKCDSSMSTLILVKVDTGRECESVVGGYADRSWSQAPGTTRSRHGASVVNIGGYYYYKPSSQAFVFSLKNDDTDTRDTPNSVHGTSSRATKYDIGMQAAQSALICHASCGPRFGNFDLWVPLNGNSTKLTAGSSNPEKYIGGTELLYAHNKPILDVEVFCFEEPQATTLTVSAPPDDIAETSVEAHGPVIDNTDGVEVADIHSFGSSMAGSFVLERGVIAAAKAELTQANETVMAAVQALETMYGPGVAAGKGDTVINLSVRGTSITTLRSTLQACPESALATRFNEERWPANGKDVDEEGRRVVDCDPACFSKLLDVLRLRKRATWAGNMDEICDGPLIAVKKSNREAFDALVDMYFPGCESFIMDLVEPSAAADDNL